MSSSIEGSPIRSIQSPIGVGPKGFSQNGCSPIWGSPFEGSLIRSSQSQNVGSPIWGNEIGGSPIED